MRLNTMKNICAFKLQKHSTSIIRLSLCLMLAVFCTAINGCKSTEYVCKCDETVKDNVKYINGCFPYYYEENTPELSNVSYKRYFYFIKIDHERSDRNSLNLLKSLKTDIFYANSKGNIIFEGVLIDKSIDPATPGIPVGTAVFPFILNKWRIKVPFLTKHVDAHGKSITESHSHLSSSDFDIVKGSEATTPQQLSTLEYDQFQQK